MVDNSRKMWFKDKFYRLSVEISWEWLNTEEYSDVFSRMPSLLGNTSSTYLSLLGKGKLYV
jgi:hypothetical protein